MSCKVWVIKYAKIIAYHIHIKSTDQSKQVGVHEKNDRNEINSFGGPSRLAIHLRYQLIITSGYPFVYCCSGFRFHFQDDIAWPHRTRIGFHERKVVMTTYING